MPATAQRRHRALRRWRLLSDEIDRRRFIHVDRLDINLRRQEHGPAFSSSSLDVDRALVDRGGDG